MTYTVTGFDVCTQGFERLRNRDEFILVGYVQHDTSRADLESQFITEIEMCARPAGFDYEACRKLVRDYMSMINMTVATRYIDPPNEGDDEDHDSGCCAFLYIRDDQSDTEGT